MKPSKLLGKICLISLFIFSLSCEKLENPAIQKIEDKSAVKIEKELLSIGEGVATFINNSEFKNYLYNQVEKKFDGDYNVLMTEVDNKYGSNLRSAKVSNSMDFFESIKQFPQVFIPFYELLKQNNILGKFEPFIVIYTDENDEGEYEGYSIDVEGNLQKIDFLIDEEFARNNEVWVISINERVDENGTVIYNDEDFIANSLLLNHNQAIDSLGVTYLDGARTACTPPATPTKDAAFPMLPKSIRVQWQDIAEVSHYKLFRETAYSGTYSEIATVLSDQGATFLDQNRAVGVHYDYQIQAFKDASCSSARSFGTGAWASWRTHNYNDILNQVYISDGCWSWCCSWPEGKIELMYRVVKYNKSDQQVEYPKNALAQKSKSSQKGKWCTYDKVLFRWDVTKYAYNYLIFFYEDDGGDDKGTTIKLSTSFKPTDKVSVGAEVSFTIDDKDEELGWVEIHHYDPIGQQYSLAPRKGSASIKVRQ